MSIRVMADVWDFGPDDSVDCFTLVCLASHANDEGASCHPSVSRVARMTRRSERTIERSIQELEKTGWIAVKRGVGRGQFNSYTINVARLKERQRVALSSDKTRQGVALSENKKATPMTTKGDTVTRKGDSHDTPIEETSRNVTEGGTAPESFPEGLSELSYAAGIMERLFLAGGARMKILMGETIRLLAKMDNLALHRAAELLEKRIAAAQNNNETINSFWFEDQKWKADGGPRHGASQGHRGVGAAGSAARVDRALSAWDRARAERDRARTVR